MENLFKVKLTKFIFIVFIALLTNAYSQEDFFVYKVKGEPYIEVNDSIKSVVKGTVLDQKTSIIMNRNDVVHFINNEGDIFELFQTGKFVHKDLKKVPEIKSNTSFSRKLFSYMWKEFTYNLAARNNKSGVIYRGDELILMRYPNDNIAIYSGEINFEWQPKEGKEKPYYFMLRNKETNQITTIGTPATMLSLSIDNILLTPGKNYDWTITETKYPNLKNTPFYSFKLLTKEEFKAKESEIKEISAFLKQLGFSKTEIRETICQDYKICY